ncbi:MAG: hypothetical protein IJ720_00365 [Clostridia bacterium]|nr:hypothetical protein [Clostridia bacterium]MBR1703797.1 hypothetical protein [Clostridia bacterium]
MEQNPSTRAGLIERRLEFRDVLRHVVRLAVPAFMSSLLVFLMNLLNYIVLAAFADYEAIASYGIVSAYTNLSAGFFVPIATGTGYLLERAQKAGDQHKVQSIISTTLIASLAVGIVSSAFMFLITPGYIWQVVTPDEIRESTTIFFRYFSLTLTPILMFSVTTIILIQTGERAGPVLAEISALALHAGFSYIFVGLFAWDTRGIAISAVVAQSTGTLINLHLVNQKRRKYLSNASKHVDWSVIRELFKEGRTGIFIAILGGVFAIFLQFFIDEMGVTTIAGFTLFFLFQDFLFIPINSLRGPTRTLSAERYEAGGELSLIRSVNPILIVATVYSLILIPVTRLIGPPIFMLLSHDPEVTIIAMRLVNLVTFYYLFYALSTLLSASLEGLGKKAVTMNLNIGFNYFIRFLVLLLAAMIIQGDESIAICYPVSWALATASLTIYYFANYSISRKYSI